MFNLPQSDELLASQARLADLLSEGHKALHSPAAHTQRILEQQADAQARSLAAAQRMMERFEWRPVASVALVQRYHCTACGEETHVFAGFGVLMQRNADGCERILVTKSLDQAYRRETRFFDSSTTACLECVEEQGFTLPDYED